MTPEELEKQLEHLYQSAESASSEGLTDEAISRCEQALELIDSFGDEGTTRTYSDFVMLMGDVYWGAGDYEDAFRSYNRVALNDPERLDARVALGVALFHLCRFHAARTILEMCSIEAADDAETWYYLGLLALRDEQPALAMHYFKEAHELNEERFHLPVEISDERIREIVNTMIDDIPAPIRKALGNCPIILEKRPSTELLLSEEPPMDPTLLGIFDGIPLTERESSSGFEIPTRIILFTENIWLMAHDMAMLEEELWVTLKHEIGHFLGLSEEELAERGLD
jgi:predicted Zn-dependent protease with MMP-like domain